MNTHSLSGLFRRKVLMVATSGLFFFSNVQGQDLDGKALLAESRTRQRDLGTVERIREEPYANPKTPGKTGVKRTVQYTRYLPNRTAWITTETFVDNKLVGKTVTNDEGMWTIYDKYAILMKYASQPPMVATEEVKVAPSTFTAEIAVLDGRDYYKVTETLSAEMIERQRAVRDKIEGDYLGSSFMKFIGTLTRTQQKQFNSLNDPDHGLMAKRVYFIDKETMLTRSTAHYSPSGKLQQNYSYDKVRASEAGVGHFQIDRSFTIRIARTPKELADTLLELSKARNLNGPKQ